MNGQNKSETEKQIKKTKVYLTADEMVGLILDWSMSLTRPEWINQLVGDLAEEEKIRIISAIVDRIPNGFIVKDVTLQFLQNYKGEDDE